MRKTNCGEQPGLTSYRCCADASLVSQDMIATLSNRAAFLEDRHVLLEERNVYLEGRMAYLEQTSNAQLDRTCTEALQVLRRAGMTICSPYSGCRLLMMLTPQLQLSVFRMRHQQQPVVSSEAVH